MLNGAEFAFDGNILLLVKKEQGSLITDVKYNSKDIVESYCLFYYQSVSTTSVLVSTTRLTLWFFITCWTTIHTIYSYKFIRLSFTTCIFSFSFF